MREITPSGELRQRAAGEVRPGGAQSSAGSVTGARHANRSHTYTAGFPSTSDLPASSGTPSVGPDRDDRVRLPRRERCPRHVRLDRADDRELARRAQVQVERAERPAEGGGRALERGQDEPEHGDAAPLELVVAVDPREAEQHVREHRVAGRERMVVELLRPRDEALAVDGREEEAAVLVVGEELDREPREPVRLLEPPQLAGRDVQLEQAVRDVRVVVEVAGAARAPVAAAAAQPAVLVGERAEQERAEVCGPPRPSRPARAAAPPPRARRARARSRMRSPCRRAAASAAARAARAAGRASPRRPRRG